jgi:anaerobic dimethyl sulfoxide reductase subunit B (iron-sulfur subunit)
MQYTFYFDQSRCTGCSTCVVACKDWNGGIPGNVNYRKLITVEESLKYPNIKIRNTVFSCNHCAKPACVPVCPVEAITKREGDGIVVVNRNDCIACGSCAVACPFGAPQFGDDISEPVSENTWQEKHPMQKCDFCLGRLDAGARPICVGACMVRAIDAGPADEIRKKYPEMVSTVTGFPSDRYEFDGKTVLDNPTNPSILFKPSK